MFVEPSPQEHQTPVAAAPSSRSSRPVAPAPGYRCSGWHCRHARTDKLRNACSVCSSIQPLIAWRELWSNGRSGTDAGLAGRGPLRPRPLPLAAALRPREVRTSRRPPPRAGLRPAEASAAPQGIGSNRPRAAGRSWINRTSVRTVQLRDVLTGGGRPLVSCVNRCKDRLRVPQPAHAAPGTSSPLTRIEGRGVRLPLGSRKNP